MAIDSGNEIDWGKTADDYSLHRGEMPESFFRKLLAHGVGMEGQRVLDLGTGTGNLAREFARNGAVVAGIDIADGQIKAARRLAQEQKLDIDFQVATAEAVPFDDNAFDCVTANQCFLYFDTEKALDEIKRVLVPGGLLMLSHFSWLPRLDEIARASEALVLKHNPKWGAADYDGATPPYHKLSRFGLVVRAMWFYDVQVPFTAEGWRGRIRASRGIGASLADDQVKAFDEEHQALLAELAGDSFSVLHRIDVHILSFNGYESEHEL